MQWYMIQIQNRKISPGYKEALLLFLGVMPHQIVKDLYLKLSLKLILIIVLPMHTLTFAYLLTAK